MLQPASHTGMYALLGVFVLVLALLIGRWRTTAG